MRVVPGLCFKEWGGHTAPCNYLIINSLRNYMCPPSAMLKESRVAMCPIHMVYYR